MNFFEKELQKMFGNDALFDDAKFVSRVCMGKISKDVVVKIRFVTGIIASEYTGIRVNLINKNDGDIDTITFLFSDLLGRKQVNNSNFKDGIIPYIWEESQEKADWYVYKPTVADYKKITDAVGDYLDVFREQVQEEREEMEQQM